MKTLPILNSQSHENSKLFATESQFAKKLQDLRHHPNLIINDHIINDETCSQLASYMLNNDILLTIEAKGGNVTGQGLAFLSEVIAKTNVLKTLNFSNNKISDADPGLKSFFLSLAHNTCIQDIDFSGNHLGEVSAIYIGDLIKKNNILKSIN